MGCDADVLVGNPIGLYRSRASIRKRGASIEMILRLPYIQMLESSMYFD